MLGMLSTWMRESGSPSETVFMAVSSSVRNVDTVVISATVLVQRSLAPIRISTSWAP